MKKPTFVSTPVRPLAGAGGTSLSTGMKETGFGPRFEVHGPLTTPDGRLPSVCTVWQLDHGEFAPRLITAYPLESEHDQ